MRSRTLAILSLLACGLVLGGSLWIVRTVARRSEPGRHAGGEEQAGPWYFLGDEDYRLIAVLDGQPVFFNEFREQDWRTVLQHLAGLPSAAEADWREKVRESQLRPDIVPPVGFYTVSDNQLLAVPREVFSVALEEGRTVKLSMITVDGRSVLAPADPATGYAGCRVISSADHRLSLIPGRDRLWLVDPVRQIALLVSATGYEGKTIDELGDAFRALRGGIAVGLRWQEDPMPSPDGSRVVFVTNRDSIEGGTSIWANHLPSGREYALLRNAPGEYTHYRVEGWVDDGHLLVTRLPGPAERPVHYLLALSGELTPLGFEGEYLAKAGIGPGGMVVCQPNASTRDLCIARIDVAAKSVNTILSIQMQGSLRVGPGDCGLISPGASRVAYINWVDDGTPRGTKVLFVVDLESRREWMITAPTGDAWVRDFEWIDEQRLLIRITTKEGDVRDISTWVYDLREAPLPTSLVAGPAPPLPAPAEPEQEPSCSYGMEAPEWSCRLMRWAPGGASEVLGDFVLPWPVEAVTLQAEEGDVFFAAGGVQFENDFGHCLWRWQAGAPTPLTPVGDLWRVTGGRAWVFPRGDDLLVRILGSISIIDRCGKTVGTLVEGYRPRGTAIGPGGEVTGYPLSVALGPGGEVAVVLSTLDRDRQVLLDLVIFGETLESYRSWKRICRHGIQESHVPDVMPLWLGDEIFFLTLTDTRLQYWRARRLVSFDLRSGCLREVAGPVSRGWPVGLSHYALQYENGDWELWDLAASSSRILSPTGAMGDRWAEPVALVGDWIVLRVGEFGKKRLVAWNPAGEEVPLGPGDPVASTGEAFLWLVPEAPVGK